MQERENMICEYKPGEYIIYGNTGVCCIDSIITPDSNDVKHGFDKSRCYYVLKPLYHTETIYTPTDNTRVFMRRVISKEEAERLIDLIPTIQAEAYHADSLQDLRNHYKSVTESYDCSDLIELTMSIYAKKQYAEQQKRKFGEVDGKFMKQAEEMLFGEFSVALGIDRKDVPDYISERVMKKSSAEAL